jgi:hypothetical protein
VVKVQGKDQLLIYAWKGQYKISQHLPESQYRLPKKNIIKNTIYTACPNCSLKMTLPETPVFQLSFNSEQINMQIVFIQWDISTTDLLMT